MSITFADLFKLYYDRHVKVRNKSPQNAHYFWTAHGPHWQNRIIKEITRFEVQEWFDKLAASSKSSALRAVHVMSAVINWGIRRGYVEGINPCRGIEKVKLPPRERFLLPAEIDRFKDSLEEEGELLRDFFWMCLLTGARRGNVQAMRWGEIDTDLAIWRIPPDKFKNQSSHHIALSVSALAILQRRRQRQPDAEWIFPSPRTSGHLVEPKRAWKRILKRAGIEDLRIHDLRRTLGSYLAIQGASPYLIGKALGHKDPRSTAVYAQLDLQAVRHALEKVNEQFLG